MSIKELDKTLEQYYKLLQRDDYRINDITNGMGKFEFFCEENGFVDDDIKAELATGAEECTLIEMDMDPINDDINNFPLRNPTRYPSDPNGDQTARNQAIYDVIKHCFDKKAPPSLKIFDIHSIDINIKNFVKKDIKNKYTKQLPVLGQFFKTEPALMEWTIIGNANHIPLLSWIVDAYMKDKTTYYFKKKSSLKVDQWCKDKENKFMSFIKSMNKKKAEELENAIKSYCNRILAGLQFQPYRKVDDDITEIVKYVVGIPDFITSKLKDGALPPFQVDLMIAIKSTSINTTDNANDNDDDVLDDNSDDDKDDDDDDYDDLIGDVQDKIQDLPHKTIVVDQSDQNDKVNLPMSRYYDDMYQHGFSNAADDQKNDNIPYPSKRRFCIFVDRRNPNKNNLNDKNDNMIMFRPPSYAIPKAPVDEWFFESNRQCLIPRRGYDKNKIIIEKDNDDNITSASGTNGQLMTFSFHVDQGELIKCYINWSGQTMRVHGYHLSKVLPLLFVDGDSKNKYLSSDELKSWEKQFTKSLKDDKFEKFYQGISIFNAKT